MLTSYEVRREFTRGRGESIALALILSFFVGGIAMAITAAAIGSAWWGFLIGLGLFPLPVWRNRKRRQLRAATLGLNAAYRAISQGRLGEAEELLFTVQSMTRARW